MTLLTRAFDASLRMLLGGLGQLGRFLVDALRVLGAHWPELLGLFLAGWAARMGVLWLAVLVSDWSPTVAVLIVPLAPMATLLSLVLMLRAMAPTLPAFRDMVESVPERRQWHDDLVAAAHVLIPFLAVYASAGLLKQDVTLFIHDSTADEWINANVQRLDFGRAQYAPGATLIVFILVGLVTRKLITLRGLAERHLAWAGVAIYLEVLWLMTLAAALTAQVDALAEWVLTRKAFAGPAQWWESSIEFVRHWGGWLVTAVEALINLLTNLGDVVVIPVAWLAIGASVYGFKLRDSNLRVETHEEITRKIREIPNPVRRAVGHVVEPVVTPVKDTLEAIAKVASAGVVPMVLFCIVFLVANNLQIVAAWLGRLAIGPGTDVRQYALEPYLMLAERAVYFVLVLALLGAAVNVLVTTQQETDHEAVATASAG